MPYQLGTDPDIDRALMELRWACLVGLGRKKFGKRKPTMPDVSLWGLYESPGTDTANIVEGMEVDHGDVLCRAGFE